jgi:hypothetical protein
VGREIGEDEVGHLRAAISKVWIDGGKVGLMQLAEFDPFRHRPGNVATS